VLIALTLVATAGTALVALTAQAADAARRARAAEARAERAQRFFAAVALWPREDLDRRLGDRAQGPWRLRIARPAEAFYVVALADSGTVGRTLLATALYRPMADSAQGAGGGQGGWHGLR